MIFIVKPFLKRIGDLYGSKDSIGKPVLAIFFFFDSFFLCYRSNWYSCPFGAFMMGSIMPDISKLNDIYRKVEDVAVILLLPCFFVFTGLKTEIGLINDPYLWKVTGAIILVAVVGKFLGSALAAKFVGQNWKDSLTIGALMNTRG
jgi:Kef-type K+ transport system membrane component KefB